MTTSLEDFLRRPFDAYVVRRTFAFWQYGASVNGLIVWGAPDAADVVEMCRAFDVVLGPRVSRHVSLVDVRSLAHVDASAFASLLEFMIERRAAYASRTERQAVVCERGALGAAIIGLYHMMSPAYPTAVFYDPRDALSWLVGDDARVLRCFELVREQALAEMLSLVRVRAALHSGHETLLAVAKAMGVSSRSLQRQLALAGTSFRKERDRHRVDEARSLLLETELPVAAVSAQVGFRTASAFVAAFRRATGSTPAIFRTETRNRPVQQA